MKLLKQLGLAVGLMVTMASMAVAQCASRCCEVCGKKVCHLEVSQEKESISSFDVKPKDICIPGIKLPWECKRRCGGVRTICALETVKGEKTVCKYDWSVKVICTACCSKHGLKRGKASCDVCVDARVPFEYYAAEPLPESDRSFPVVQPVSVEMNRVPGALPAAVATTEARLEIASPEAVARSAPAKGDSEEKLSSLTRLRQATKSIWGVTPAK